ncbi:MAG: hypothetical protein ABFS35_13195, partial [Bacteroidota bacterium]
VYYNPAGLTKLSDGLHLSISNQTLGQTKNVVNDFNYLNGTPVDYQGDVSAPMFPGFYAAYKTGKVVFSFGFNPIGGGGSADFAAGLPSIEMPASTLVPSFASQGMDVTGYSLSMNFSGTSVYFGFQAGVSYEINDMLSVYAGGRYIMAKNTYKGEIKDVMVSSTSKGDMAPGAYLTSLAGDATAGATAATGGGDNLQAAFDAGLLDPAYPINGVTDPEGAVTGGLLALGYTQAEINGMDMGDAQTSFYTSAAILTGTAAQLTAMSPVVAAQTADQEADVEQTGSGFTPIVGVNLSLMEDKLNIGIKYEFKTNLELTNNTTSDVTTKWDMAGQPTGSMFSDGEIINADMPAMLSIGVRYELMEGLNVHAGFHTYFDKQVGWIKTVNDIDYTAEDFIDKNSMEYALGLEYNINEKLLVSAGWLGTNTGVNDLYQSDLSYSINTNSFGAGGAFAINDMITIQLGGFMTMYQDATVAKEYNLGDMVPYNETYKKSAWGIGVGLDFTFGGK